MTVYAERLTALRERLKELALDGLLVPMADSYQNEYVPESDRRIEFLTGFTGSAGFVLVLADTALFFTDSRYTLQASQQVPADLYKQFDTENQTPSEWMVGNLSPGALIGFDPQLHSAAQIDHLRSKLTKRSIEFLALEANPLDGLWADRPAAPSALIVQHDMAYAGKSSADKRREIAEKLKNEGLNAAVITDPASVAWLLNVRGGDVPYTPLPLSRAIIKADGTAEWFVSRKKLSPQLEATLNADVLLFDEKEFTQGLKRLGEARSRVLVDANSASYAIVHALSTSGATLEKGDDPCALPRACKNQTETDGMRAAHRRDSAALVSFMAWFDQALARGDKLTELDVEKKLHAFRAGGQFFQGPSFATIAGAGPNGAIVHYRATEASNRAIEPIGFLLLDSGAQYLDGTTDVTRTLVTGDLTQEMKDRYTRVLKGHIAMAAIRFPEGTCGADLDVLARQYLWDCGLDYGHGTGHGVGSYLGVHEGPQSISRRSRTPFKPGMVLSNEPGYYKARHYGIRLENLQCVVEMFEISGDERKMLGFEPLTFAPFDRRAILPDMLTVSEKTWLNAYHARVNAALRPQLDEATREWLVRMTEAI